MDPRPELPPEEQDLVREKTRRMVAVAALRKIQQLVREYREGKQPADFQRPMPFRSGLSSRDQELIPGSARRMAGYAALHKVQQLVREYRDGQKAARKAARQIATFFAVLLVGGAVLYLVIPSVLRMLFRMLT
jgi:hypothetical protein